MYGKLIDGSFHEAPKVIKKDGKVIYNPTDEMYEAEGYMKVVETPYPEALEGEEPKYYTFEWVEQDGKIVKVWNESEPDDTVESKPTVEDRIFKLETGLSDTNAELENTMQAVDYLLMGGVTDDTILDNEN